MRRTLRAVIGPVLALAAVLALASPVAAAPATATADGAVRGGDVLFRTGGHCTVAFNATDDTARYGLMAGDCGTVGTRWYRDRALTVPVGVTTIARFPGASWSVVRYTNTTLDYPSEIGGPGGAVRITQAQQPALGQAACRYGRTTGLHCGTVTGVNQTIRLPQGTLRGLFRATICGEPGDAGGPVSAGSRGLGILVVSIGNCAIGGSTYHQPLAPVLAATGLRVGY
ncbi:S1 family peptidase [Streptomyces sp. TRM70308]|uniref:S1 family peptidase n=1 Tax=Streptomyces sp. TRM70308 TaxID=3131932 RepID=UPI003CFE79B6